MTLTDFDPPGFVDDLDSNASVLWSNWVSEQLSAARDRDGDGLFSHYGPRPQFFNALTHPPDADATEADITWTAFPRQVTVQSVGNRQRWQTADSSRDLQDEYCEWSVTRDATGKIRRVTFTSEGPEYWQFLATVHPERALALYQQHVDPAVQADDLFPAGRYEPRNPFNRTTTQGAMHLIQPANTLGAEIELAAAATLLRRKDGKLLTTEQELIRCARYGVATRHSDPHIGAQVNALARLNADITLANPVGLYIADLSTAGWETPDGCDPKRFWRITRGTPEKAVRAVYEVPVDLGYTVSDVRIGGQPIEYGAQIADFITIKLTGVATRIGQRPAHPIDGCVMRLEAQASTLVASVTAALDGPRPFAHRW